MFALNTPDLRGQILRHRALHPDRFKKCRKAEAGRAQKIKELSQLNNVIRTAGKATVDSRTQVLKHMLEARDQECRILDEIKQKEVASAQMCSLVDEKLAQFVDKEYSINATCADPTIALLDDDPRLKEFARRIRSKAVGLIQRAQIIENKQRREKRAMEIKEQEKCWLEEYTAKNCDMELKERLTEINKKKDFREGIIKQIATHPSKDCTNFEAEKERCEEVLAKELAEIKAEKEATFHRKEALKRSTLEELSRRKKELSDRKQDELDFEMKKLLEQEALNVAIDAGRDTWSKNVEANRRRQELAALKLVEMQHAAESSLSKQAAKASSEIEIGRAILVSAQEADEVFNEPKQRAIQQRDYCNQLDRVLELKKMAIKEEKDREKELDRIYLEACKQEETKLKNEDEFQRDVGLEMGKCLR
uniref:Trichohyalin-plectin-homology domain-containing protein n=1 Tax=Echinococcus canadensis TaxID=519352 RepID=A0A915ESM7_9CEST